MRRVILPAAVASADNCWVSRSTKQRSSREKHNRPTDSGLARLARWRAATTDDATVARRCRAVGGCGEGTQARKVTSQAD